MALRNPGFTAVAVLTLAVGISINSTVFSWVDMILLRPIPAVTNGGELRVFESVAPDGQALNTSWRDFLDYRDHLQLLSGLTAASQVTLNYGEGDHADRIWGELVSSNYFNVLGVKPALGRMFSPQECGDNQDSCPVAIVSNGLWKSRFHADPGVIGATIVLNRQKLTVIGVTPAGFRGSTPGLTFSIWIPATMGARLNTLPEKVLDERRMRFFMLLARLKPGVTTAQARAECSSLARQLAQSNPHADAGIGATVLPIRKGHFGGQTILGGPLTILMAACGLVFLIVCANVANLLLARSIARSKEFSVRMAMGAGRRRLARQLFSESLILAVLGGVAGAYLSTWMSASMGYLMPRGAGLPVSLDFPLNGEILAFGVILCMAACLISGIAPALYSGRASLNEALKEGGRSGGGSTRSEHARGLLVVSEVALALVAVIGAGLFTKSFEMAREINPGFDPRNVLVSHLELSSAGYAPGLGRSQFFDRLQERLASQPGIVSVSWAEAVPLWFTGTPWEGLSVEGYVPGPAENMNVYRNLVGPGFLNLMKIPIVEGRDFTGHDDENGKPVIIVNHTFAQRFFAGRSPIGHRVFAWGRWYEVAGVAADGKYVAANEPPQPFFYVPFRQAFATRDMNLFIRTTGDPERAIAAERSAVNSLNPSVGIFDSMPLTDYIGASLFGQKTAAVMLAVLGFVALILAATGLYSVMAYSVAQRTREIGLRMALGARPADVLALVVGRGMRLTLVGVAIGVVAALAVTRLASSLLVHVSATDPLVFAAASLFLAAVALAANYLPARRATHIDPNEALRSE